MSEQYVAKDKDTGFEVTVTGDFPEHPDDRMRIARTTTLFTRLMSTLLQRGESQRRMGFRAIETQLELADALIRQDHPEVQRLVRETLTSMGVSEDQLRELAERLAEASGLDPHVARELSRAFGLDGDLTDTDPDLDVPTAELEEHPGEPLAPGIMGQLEDLLAEAESQVAELKSLERKLEELEKLEAEALSQAASQGAEAGEQRESSEPSNEADDEPRDDLKGTTT